MPQDNSFNNNVANNTETIIKHRLIEAETTLKMICTMNKHNINSLIDELQLPLLKQFQSISDLQQQVKQPANTYTNGKFSNCNLNTKNPNYVKKFESPQVPESKNKVDLIVSNSNSLTM